VQAVARRAELVMAWAVLVAKGACWQLGIACKTSRLWRLQDPSVGCLSNSTVPPGSMMQLRLQGLQEIWGPSCSSTASRSDVAFIWRISPLLPHLKGLCCRSAAQVYVAAAGHGCGVSDVHVRAPAIVLLALMDLLVALVHVPCNT
jgi:hypothetical protein